MKRQAVDPFSILGIAPHFELSHGEIERRQRELYVERKGEGAGSLEAINQAVRVLKDPTLRAEQLFLLRGWPIKDNPDPALLERVFTDREFIEQARRKKDLEALQAWLDDLKPRLKAILSQLSAVLDAPSDASQPATEAARGSDVDAPESSAARALSLLNELRYLGRADAAAEAALLALSDED